MSGCRDERLHLGLVPADERVQHQRHAALAGMPGLPPGLPVERELGAQLLDALSQQVRQHAGTDEPRLAVGLRSPGGGEPHRQFRLHRPRQGADRHHAAIHAGQLDGLAAPQPAHHLDIARHDRLVVGIGLRAQHEVVRLPARGEGHARAAAGDAVDDRPLLGDAGRMVQWQDHAAAAHVHPVRHRGHRGAGHRRIRVDAAEGVEVTLRRPHRLEAPGIGEARPVEQQAVLVGACLGAREVEKAERRMPARLLRARQ